MKNKPKLMNYIPVIALIEFVSKAYSFTGRVN